MGVASHFARLRLLDPDRYHSLERFREEEAHYVEVAEAIDALERLPGAAADRERVAAVIDEADSLALLDTLANPEASEAQHAAAREIGRASCRERVRTAGGAGA